MSDACERCWSEHHEPLAARLVKGARRRSPPTAQGLPVASNVVAQPEEHCGEEDCGGETRGQDDREIVGGETKQLKANRETTRPKAAKKVASVD